MRIAIFTDVHANLPALKAVLSEIQAKGYDEMVHLGDVISIGPFPRECLEILLSMESIQLIMGNHDEYFVNGLPDPRPDWLSDGEIELQLWTHAQLGEQHRNAIASWPFMIERTLQSVRVLFTHYALAEDGRSFKPFRFNPTARDLDKLFEGFDADLVFLGHDHEAVELRGAAHYINPGSLGCQKTAVAPYSLLELTAQGLQVSHYRVYYDDVDVYRAFQSRGVPSREFIQETFFGGRYTVGGPKRE